MAGTGLRRVAWALVPSALLASGAHAAGGRGAAATSTKYLMVDDALLESRSQVRLTMHPPHVDDVPAIVPSEPWESHSVGGPITVVDFSPTEKRLYYGCNELLPDGNSAENRQCLAISVDGRDWRKPALGLVERAGSKANNILAPFNNRCAQADNHPHVPLQKTALMHPSAGSAVPPAGWMCSATTDAACRRLSGGRRSSTKKEAITSGCLRTRSISPATAIRASPC